MMALAEWVIISMALVVSLIPVQSITPETFMTLGSGVMMLIIRLLQL
jgi:hypothetical protein